MSNEVEKATATATSEDFRPLPTPEQVRAHGDGGLWESNRGALYRFFDRPRNEAWWDVGGDNGGGFLRHESPWAFGKGDPRDSGVRGADSFRPLNTIGKPRPWSEIDAITGATTPTTPATSAIVPPPGGKFQVGDVVTLHRFSNDEKFAGGNPHWAEPMTHLVGRTVTIDSVPDYVPGRVRACGWTWPVERVSFVSRPDVTAATIETVTVSSPTTSRPSTAIVATSSPDPG